MFDNIKKNYEKNLEKRLERKNTVGELVGDIILIPIAVYIIWFFGRNYGWFSAFLPLIFVVVVFPKLSDLIFFLLREKGMKRAHKSYTYFSKVFIILLTFLVYCSFLK